MRAFRHTLTLGAAAAIIGGASVLAAAQTASAPPQGPRYDVKTEVTISGVIDSVEAVTGQGGRGRRGLGGTHLTVTTDKEALAVHVGPTAYLQEKGIALAKGDTVEVLGSRVTIDNEPVLIAKEIKKDGKTWTLRDASGRPLWSGPRK